MKSSTNQFIVSLSPDTLSAAIVRRGEVIQAERLDLDPDAWAVCGQMD